MAGFPSYAIGVEPAFALLAQMRLPALAARLSPHGLAIMGVLQDGDATIMLIGTEGAAWGHFKGSTEFSDGRPNPLDRWSKRLIGLLADEHGATAFYPSDGPPYSPFIAWALKTGRFWQSPTGMMIHDQAGLMVSIRGALRFDEALPLEAQQTASPCESCADRPCTTACPVSALSADAFYDVPTCKGFLASEGGQDCMKSGCLARRACPVSQSHGRDSEQSAFHMRAFMKV